MLISPLSLALGVGCYCFLNKEGLANVKMMQKIQQVFSEEKKFTLIVHAIPAQNLRDYFAPETQFKSSELVEVAEDYLIVKKQGQLVLIPEQQIALVIIS